MRAAFPHHDVAEAKTAGHPVEMSKSRQDVVSDSRRKGFVAGAAAVATVAIGATIGLPVAAVAAVPTALLGWRWWRHRAENGIKF
jgi:hypothetical protein